MRITDDIKYVGVNDRKIDLFEGQYKVPCGISYNSYVIIDDKIADIPEVTPGLSASEIQGMIDASITVDNLKDHIETVVPDVIPEATIEVTSDSLETPTTVKVVEVAEKAIVNEIEITKIKEVTEDCVCDTHADDYFTEIFK